MSPGQVGAEDRNRKAQEPFGGRGVRWGGTPKLAELTWRQKLDCGGLSSRAEAVPEDGVCCLCWAAEPWGSALGRSPVASLGAVPAFPRAAPLGFSPG